MEKFKYSEEESRNEASKMTELVGDKGSKEEYDISEELIEEQEQKIRQERFEKTLQGKFNDFVSDVFISELPNTERISIIKSPPNPQSGHIEQLFAKVIYEIDGKEKGQTFTLSKDGSLIGKIPKDLHLRKEQIYDEILSIAEAENVGFFVNIDQTMLDGEGLPVKEDFPGNITGGVYPAFDPERLRFMRSNPDVLFGLASGNNGFTRGYHGFVFPQFILFDADKSGNPILVYYFEEPIKINNSQRTSSGYKLSRKERNQIIKQYEIDAISKLTRKEFESIGGIRKYNRQRWRLEQHEKESDKEYEQRWREKWKERMTNLIDDIRKSSPTNFVNQN